MSTTDSSATMLHADGLTIGRGSPTPMGATAVSGGINFAIFSQHATGCTLVLYRRGQMEPFTELPFPAAYRTGHVFAMTVLGLDTEDLEYGFRMDGPNKPEAGLRFDAGQVLLDPFARGISGRPEWGKPGPTPFRSRFVPAERNVGRQLQTPLEDLIIYELHVRGLTRHHTSAVDAPGTYAGLREKIPYLKALGVNAVELLPIHEFDELDNRFTNPVTSQPLLNYWGYATLGFFAPKAAYAASGPTGGESNELKAMINDLHDNGIEVILDVVFNHTGEGDKFGRTYSFRGIDNKVYYLLGPHGNYLNYSGTGNTVNCNHPVVARMIVDSLRYWVSEYHIDGFRFDLASILTRGPDGLPMDNPPVVAAIARDPVLGRTKLIAEAWDAVGLYQVGTFPDYGRWSEWNDQFRDTLRRFLKGDGGQVRPMSKRIQGSPDLYPARGPTASINYITSHDGFTLADMVSYSQKHNTANGEGNRDGHNDNESWNWGHEGPTDDEAIASLRRQVMKNGLAILLLSQGVPMMFMGDETGRSKGGNNNTYALDSAVNWFDWSLHEKNADLVRYTSNLIHFRRKHHILRRPIHLTNEDEAGSGYPDISWHGVEAWRPDWSESSRAVAFLLCGDHAALLPGEMADDMIYVAMNMHWEPHSFELPKLTHERRWRRFVDTALNSPDDSAEPGSELPLLDQSAYFLQPRSVVVLVGRE